MATTAAEARPLTETEKRQLLDLLARENAGGSPALRVGEPYIALINLSVPRRGDPDHQADLVMAGETVYLTDAEAQKYLRHGPKDGRQIAVVRKATGPQSSREAPPRVPPRAVSGRLQAPPPPAPGTDGPRPDPAGSSAVLVTESIPETAEPAPGSENSQVMPPAPTDAEDIVTDRVRQRARSAQGR